MSETIKIFSSNILEDGTVTVTGDPDTGYPEARLWDWSPNLYWKITDPSPEDYSFEVNFQGDQFGFSDDFGFNDEFGFTGDSAPAIDLLYVAGHNFSGCTCSWQYSGDGTNWTTAETWSQTANNPIVKTLASALQHNIWRLYVEGIANPMCGEIIMCEGVSFSVQANPNPEHGYRSNIARGLSVGGQEGPVKLLDYRTLCRYVMRLADSDLDVFKDIISDDTDAFSRPFLVKDNEDEYRMMRFASIPGLSDLDAFTEIDLRLISV